MKRHAFNGLFVLLSAALVAQAAGRPNMIFILSDDLAQGDVGCYGQKLIQTPNLDRMAREGTRFTQAYCGTTVCAPSRASLMTGLHTGHSPVRANWEIAPGEGQLPLPASTVTVAQVLKESGYATACVGKWGMGMFDTTGSPLKKGFDHFFGYNCQRHAHSYFPTHLYRDGERFELPGNDGKGVGQTYAQELIQRDAEQWLRANRQRPFFLFYAITLPHGRHEIDDLGPYAKTDWTPQQKAYAAQVSRLDADVGRILALLKELQLTDNTLVMLAGDNGSSFDETSELGRRFDQSMGGKLRGFKRSMYEGGLRQAALACWPGVVPAGRVCDDPWAFWDFLPTAAELAGTRLPDGLQTDSLSLTAMLKGGPGPQRDYFYWELHEASFIQAVRFGDWKAVRNGPAKPIELYDLATDAGERHDVASRHADLVAKAESLMKSARRDDPNWPIFESQRQRSQWRKSRESNVTEVKAFPGAEGWGAVSVGGRGGKVIKVTTLNAAGPGSLGEACATEGRRIVVFDVSGVIRGNIRITQPFITIAGQTAPGAGITIEGMISSYDHGAHDIILRNLRIRRNRDRGAGGDCLQLGGLGPARTGTYNIILDHLSLSWGNDEVIDLYHTHDATVQWCTIEESDDQGHNKGAHNFGIISAAENNGAVSVHHNLWAHHGRRVPCMAPYRENAASDFCNNLIYNCRGGYTDDGHGNRARSPVNLHKNYYKRGPQTMDRMYPFALSPQMDYYVQDNYFEDWDYQGHPRHWKFGNLAAGGVPRWIQFNNNGREIDEPASVPAVQMVDARQAYHLVLAKAGCWPRDRVTSRTVAEVTNKSGAWGRNAPLQLTDEWFLEGLAPSKALTDTDSDGMPDEWELVRGLNPRDPIDANRIVPAGQSAGDRHQGYTYSSFISTSWRITSFRDNSPAPIDASPLRPPCSRFSPRTPLRPGRRSRSASCGTCPECGRCRG